jgi:hypothetical protein
VKAREVRKEVLNTQREKSFLIWKLNYEDVIPLFEFRPLVAIQESYLKSNRCKLFFHTGDGVSTARLYDDD